MRRHQLLALLLLALAAASLLLLLQAEVEAGAEGSANYRHFMATLAASNTSATRSLGQCSIPPLEVVYNDLAYRKAFWPKVAARCKHEQPRLTYMEVLHTKYFFNSKNIFLTVQMFPGRYVPVEPQRAGQPQPPTVVRGKLRVAGVRQ